MILHYMGYEGSVEYDCENGYYFGKLTNINDKVNYEAYTLEGLFIAFENAIKRHEDQIQYH